MASRRKDPDETEGRRLYRAVADREARAQTCLDERRIRLHTGRRCVDGSIMPEDGSCPKCYALQGETCRDKETP